MNKTVIKIAIVLCIAIPVVNALALLTGFASNNPLVYVWPGFFVTLLFLIGKEKTLRDCGNIVCSGIVGIIWSLLGGLLIGVLSGVMPTLAALSLGVGLSLIHILFLSCRSLSTQEQRSIWLLRNNGDGSAQESSWAYLRSSRYDNHKQLEESDQRTLLFSMK